jgi:hypothetical protein
MKARDPLSSLDPGGGPLVTPRSILALVLIVLGIAVVVYYYIVVRPGPEVESSWREVKRLCRQVTEILGA